ncbi:MAG: putative Ig domain-containing protein, partial [Proteobacteria bacterium]|nr:putative Ig domain-containing protein [Pseudomonadota bacterium]
MKHKSTSAEALRRVRRIAFLFIFALLSTPAMAALPVLTVPTLPTNIDELAVFWFTATATDADLPDDTLTFSLEDGASGSVPAGASITAGGDFTWTPTEAQGPGDYQFDVVVT